MAENQNPFATTDRNLYGAHETNGLLDGHAYHEAVDYTVQYTLKDVAEAGGKITRLRLLTEVWPGAGRRCDVSYCHATLPNGKTVPVQVGWNVNGVFLRDMKKALIDWAKEEGVFAKGLGLLDEGNWSVL
jgi:hypothetical protein